MLLEDCTVLGNFKVTDNTYLLKIVSTKAILEARPGQFFMLKCKNGIHTLRRPISLHSIDAKANIIEFYYEIKGEGTNDISSYKTGDLINIQGPLGNGFPTDITDANILLVGGGMGIAPLNYLISSLKSSNKITLVIGGRNADSMVILQNFDLEGIEAIITTDDGSLGIKGTVIPTLQDLLNKHKYDIIMTCGPHIMMQHVSKIAKEKDIPCKVSLESRMACGIGACVGCSVLTTKGMKKVCHDGPVFDADTVMDIAPASLTSACQSADEVIKK